MTICANNLSTIVECNAVGHAPYVSDMLYDCGTHLPRRTTTSRRMLINRDNLLPWLYILDPDPSHIGG